MWVDIDDVRAEIERLARKDEEKLDKKQHEVSKAIRVGILLGYTNVEIMLDKLEKVYRERESECVRGLKEESNEKQYCEWIKYDSWTICPKYHDANNPYWRILENTDKLKYCPYCGKKITIVKE